MDEGYRITSESERRNGSPPGPAPRARLRALTYLAPGIPLGFFETLTEYLAGALDCEIHLDVESRTSGPMRGDDDPFAGGRADLGFLCSPSYLYLRARARPSVELVPAGFVFRDRRNGGEPTYFSDVVVRSDHPAREFADLAGAAWGYNDACSLSGYFSTLRKLSELDLGTDFFRAQIQTGSHFRSIQAVLERSVDAAAIDSTVLAGALRQRPELAGRLRVLDSWGPFPVQPVVVRSELGSPWAARIAEALLALEGAAAPVERLASFGLDRCAPIDDAAYAGERRALGALGHLPSGWCEAARPRRG